LRKSVDHVVLECHGVGYLISVPASTAAKLPSSGRCRLFTHYAITVDVRSGSSEQRLFGFEHEEERQLFRRLIEVQGVSTTLGMAILGARSANDVVSAVLLGDEVFFKGIKGIGPKLAQRIIGDLRDRLTHLPAVPGTAAPLPGNSLKGEALQALISLGLDRAKAERSLQAVLQERSGEPPALEELIKLSLKNL
jgi:Holliday junction DNA helicase RuvA